MDLLPFADELGDVAGNPGEGLGVRGLAPIECSEDRALTAALPCAGDGEARKRVPRFAQLFDLCVQRCDSRCRQLARAGAIVRGAELEQLGNLVQREAGTL